MSDALWLKMAHRYFNLVQPYGRLSLNDGAEAMSHEIDPTRGRAKFLELLAQNSTNEEFISAERLSYSELFHLINPHLMPPLHLSFTQFKALIEREFKKSCEASLTSPLPLDD